MSAKRLRSDAIKTTSDVFIHYLLAREETEPSRVSLINAVLVDSKMVPIKSATIKNPFNVRKFPTDKETILDVSAIDEKGVRYNIEVQILQVRGFVERCLLYNGKLFASQMRKKSKYYQLKPAISIVLTEFDLFPDLHRLHVTGMMSAVEVPGRILTDKMQLHFIRLPKTLDETLTRDVNEPLVDWLRFFAFPEATSEKEFMALSKRDEGIEMAVKEYKKFCSDPELRDLYERREKFRLDFNTMLGDAEEKGEAKGLARGRAEGLAEGLAKGQAQGLAKGQAQGLAQGLAQGQVKLLLQAVESRFGSTTEEFKAKLGAIDDSAVIFQLLTYVMTSAQTLNDVEKAIS